MCNQHIYVGIFDAAEQKLCEISTDPKEFTSQTLYALLQKKFAKNLIVEKYSLDDYETLDQTENISTRKISNPFIRPNFDWIKKANEYISDLHDAYEISNKELSLTSSYSSSEI